MAYWGRGAALMELHEQVARIGSKRDLVDFIKALTVDARANVALWENHTLERYLSALAAWIDDSDGYYENRKLPVPTSPTWKNVGEMLLAAKYYE
jgi:hypothetical protein